MACVVHKENLDLCISTQLGQSEHMSTKQNQFVQTRALRAILVGLGVCVLGAATAAGGCVQQPTQLQPLPGASSGTGGGLEDAGPSNPGRDAFEAMEAELMQACGTCHDIAGLADTPFLAGPDRYQSFVSWPGILAATPAQSILLTHSMTGKGHVGTNLDSASLKDTLLPKVQSWLAEEAKSFSAPPPQPGPYIEPFAPIIGFNAVYLEPLGEAFRGMAVTFKADYLTETTLELTNIQIHTTSKAGLHIVHPLFVMHPISAAPIPDPTDSFSNVDQTLPMGSSETIGPGTFFFVNWESDSRLSIAFETIEPVLPLDPDAGEGGVDPTGGCKDVAAFDANAKVQFQTRCLSCHGGGNGQASAALDMSALASDAAKACAQIKNRVNVADTAQSQIFITTNPNGNAAHPFKFGGSTDNFNTFRNNVSMWITAEQ